MQLTSISESGEVTGEMDGDAFVGGRFHVVWTSLGLYIQSEAISMEYNTLSWKNGPSVDFSTVSCAFGVLFIYFF